MTSRTPRVRRRGGAGYPPKATLGVVRVDDDFEDEFPDGDRSATELMATLVRAGEAISEEIDRAMVASFGASQRMLNALAVIEGAQEPLTPKEVGERVLTSSGAMTVTLDQLEDRGWVERLPHPEDRRSVLVRVTDAGRQVVDQLLPGIRRLDIATTAALTPDERRTMLGLLGKVLASTAEVAAAPPVPLEGRRNHRR